MNDTAAVSRRPVDRPPAQARAQSEGVELLGPDGLLSQVTKAVLERALAEEMTGHLAVGAGVGVGEGQCSGCCWTPGVDVAAGTTGTSPAGRSVARGSYAPATVDSDGSWRVSSTWPWPAATRATWSRPRTTTSCTR
jgi:hypothetical protein